jgi:hypothetical protein
MEWIAPHHLVGMKLGADDREQYGRSRNPSVGASTNPGLFTDA